MQSTPTHPPSQRNRTIDGLRGLGAIVVMTYHYRGKFGWRDPFHEGFFLVDLFFAASGYVLASAYGARLRAGLGLGAFMRARYIRLYPVYLFATAMAVLIWSLGWASVGGKPAVFGMLPFAGTVALAMLMLPSPILSGAVYPLLYPAWTLAYELLVNAVWAKTIHRLTPKALWAVLAASALGIVVLGTEGGVRWDPVEMGMATSRAFFGFTVGLLIHRLDKAWVPRLPPLLVMAAVMAAVLIPVAEPYAEGVRVAQVLLVMPLSLLLMSVAGPGSPVEAKVYAWLGDASYGIYLLHVPVATLALRAAGGQASTRLGLISMALVCVLALLLDRLWDRPLRRWMSQLGAPAPAERSTLV